jgi:hypothetical protein
MRNDIYFDLHVVIDQGKRFYGQVIVEKVGNKEIEVVEDKV